MSVVYALSVEMASYKEFGIKDLTGVGSAAILSACLFILSCAMTLYLAAHSRTDSPSSGRYHYPIH